MILRKTTKQGAAPNGSAPCFQCTSGSPVHHRADILALCDAQHVVQVVHVEYAQDRDALVRLQRYSEYELCVLEAEVNRDAAC